MCDDDFISYSFTFWLVIYHTLDLSKSDVGSSRERTIIFHYDVLRETTIQCQTNSSNSCKSVFRSEEKSSENMLPRTLLLSYWKTIAKYCIVFLTYAHFPRTFPYFTAFLYFSGLYIGIFILT